MTSELDLREASSRIPVRITSRLAMSHEKHASTVSDASDEKIEIEEEEHHVAGFNIQHVHASVADIENAKIKEAHNAAFAAAKAKGGTKAFGKSAFMIYACELHEDSSLDKQV